MIYYDRIDVSEGRQVHQMSVLFANTGNFGSHDLLMMSIDINSPSILNVHVVDYCCIINGIRKSEALNLF